MKNNIFFKIIILFSSIFICSLLFYILYTDKNDRINLLLNQQINNLQIHYNLTTQYFKTTADHTVEVIETDPVVLDILSKFINASEKELELLRVQLYKRLETHYQWLKKQGVLQFHFVLPTNVTSLRMHKPSKFGDDLTQLKYSYRYANETRKSIRGFEEGKTAPSFRHVYPLFAKDKQYLGLVDIGFAAEILQKNLYQSSKIYSHLIIDKNILNLRKWTRNESQIFYQTSIENNQYLEPITTVQDEDKNLAQFIRPLNSQIKDKMQRKKSFAFYNSVNNTTKIIAFLPIKNIRHKIIAYLISYTNSDTLKHILSDFQGAIFTSFLIILVLALFIYKIIIYQQQLSQEKNKFYQLSQYDSLTKLPNRYLFNDRLNQFIVKAQRQKTHFSLLFIDIDNFKHINDSYGHHIGDKILLFVANKIKDLLRHEDTLARFGGDEFIVLIDEITHSEKAIIVANKIIALFKESQFFESKEYHIGLSIGISHFPMDSEDPNNLLKFADIAMYRAKELGKNNAQFYNADMTQQVVNKMTLELELRTAIKNEELIVYYQPQINAKYHQLIGMEALVRWQHPTKGLIPPFQFIPLALETGLIIELDQLVMNMAIKQFVQWYQKGLAPGVLALNIAMKQLQQNDFISILKQILEQTGCKANWLELEITEGQIMDNPELAIKVLNSICELGIEIAIDDFGTGYSSLSYLTQLPLDKLKIDRSFIKNLPNDKDGIAIAKTIISLAHSLGLSVIAEGVETEEQRDFLIDNSCVNIQGYLYSKPIPAQKMENLYLK